MESTIYWLCDYYVPVDWQIFIVKIFSLLVQATKLQTRIVHLSIQMYIIVLKIQHL